MTVEIRKCMEINNTDIQLNVRLMAFIALNVCVRKKRKAKKVSKLMNIKSVKFYKFIMILQKSHWSPLEALGCQLSIVKTGHREVGEWETGSTYQPTATWRTFYFLIFFLKILFIFLFRERRREEERKVEKHPCVVASRMPPTGDLTHNPGMCPDWESNRWSFGSQACTQSTEWHQPGPKTGFKMSEWELLIQLNALKHTLYKDKTTNTHLVHKSRWMMLKI